MGQTPSQQVAAAHENNEGVVLRERFHYP
jgi:hypothetical protein